MQGTLAQYNLLEEVKKTFELSHPNIIRYYDVFVINETTATGRETETQVGVMEYIPDGDISQLNWLNLTHDQQKDILLQILDGLEYLHEKKIIHRDIKPSNILIKKEGSRIIPKITDFGISKSQDAASVSVSRVIGSIPYMAPEQFDIKGRVSYNTDFWSMGILVNRLFTNTLPFGDESTTSEGVIMKNIMEMPLPWEVQKIPQPFRKLVELFLVKDRTERVKEALVLKEVLQVTHETWQTTTEPKVWDKQAKQPREETTRVIAREPEKQETSSPKENIREERAKVTLGQESKAKTPIQSGGSKNRKSLFWPLGIAVIMLIVVVIFFQRNAKDKDGSAGIEVTESAAEKQRLREEQARLADPFQGQMILVRGGTFTMGCTSEQGTDCLNDENPAHRVTLSDYYIGKHPVTQAQWRAIMGNNPSANSGCDDCPVTNVSWNDVQEFLRKLNQLTGKNYRLPTEAEWEYAARGGQNSLSYKYAGSNNIDEVAWYSSNSGRKTHPVGRKRPNELGIYDMSGNVWEWCSDWYGSYTSGSKTNPTGPASGSFRVNRGGSWNYYAGLCRVSYRYNGTPDYRGSSIGFRLVLAP